MMASAHWIAMAVARFDRDRDGAFSVAEWNTMMRSVHKAAINLEPDKWTDASSEGFMQVCQWAGVPPEEGTRGRMPLEYVPYAMIHQAKAEAGSHAPWWLLMCRWVARVVTIINGPPQTTCGTVKAGELGTDKSPAYMMTQALLATEGLLLASMNPQVVAYAEHAVNAIRRSLLMDAPFPAGIEQAVRDAIVGCVHHAPEALSNVGEVFAVLETELPEAWAGLSGMWESATSGARQLFDAHGDDIAVGILVGVEWSR
jgi:hypothetical protein